MEMKNFDEQTFDDKNIIRKNSTLLNVENAEPQKLLYPKRVFLIIGNEFCERFNFFGMTTILVFYLKYKLGFSEDDATVLYHTFVMMVYFMDIFGAILSDVWLGKFKTILYLSIIYVIGSTILSIGAIPGFWISPKIALYIGLTLIAIGSGGIKPCVSAFGGDQFKLPEQSAQMAKFFSMFYFVIGAATLISTLITPILRADVHCFDKNDCYSLAFGVPALLMITAVFLFITGKSSYTYLDSSSENKLINMLKCIWNAIVIKRREGKTKPRKNLLDYSTEKYGAELVNETRIMLNMLVLYLPFPFFWAIYFQTGSRWTFQAVRMNGNLGFFNLKPDQMHMIGSLLILIFIPLCDIIVYPALRKIGIKRPLQKVMIGGILASISFLLTACLQYQIESMPINSVSMLWQIPQYGALYLSLVMFQVPGMSFTYEYAPKSMKSVLISVWYLQTAIGNVILVFIVGMKFFESRIYEILFFSGIMLFSMLIFAFLVHNYEKFKQNK